MLSDKALRSIAGALREIANAIEEDCTARTLAKNPDNPFGLSESQRDLLKELIDKTEWIQAIKEVRTWANVDMRTAKRYVDHLRGIK